MTKHRQAIDAKELERVVSDITEEISSSEDRGEATRQIDALSGLDTRQFGIAILTRDGDLVCGGDADTPFSIQSISKVFSLELVLEARGDELWDRVGRDPSGDPFNSVIDLERQEGHPRNPFINAGALIVVDMLLDTLQPDEEVKAVVEFVERLLDGTTSPSTRRSPGRTRRPAVSTGRSSTSPSISATSGTTSTRS